MTLQDKLISGTHTTKHTTRIDNFKFYSVKCYSNFTCQSSRDRKRRMSTENDTNDLRICKLNLSCQVKGIIRYKHTASLWPTLPRSSLAAVSYRRIGHPTRFHALIPRLTRATRQYFVLFRQFCAVFR